MRNGVSMFWVLVTTLPRPRPRQTSPAIKFIKITNPNVIDLLLDVDIDNNPHREPGHSTDNSEDSL